LNKQLKGAIDGSVANGWFLLLNQAMQFFSSQVVVRCQENLQNCVTLRTPLELKLGKVIVQNTLCGRDVVESAGPDVYSLFWHISRTFYHL
jgi:hypothetical protein